MIQGISMRGKPCIQRIGIKSNYRHASAPSRQQKLHPAHATKTARLA
jgi:hypothetical protein